MPNLNAVGSPIKPQTIESAITGDELQVEDERDLLLSELLVLEIDYRRRNGESPTVEEYIDRFPENAKTIRDALGPGPEQGRQFEPPSIEQIAKLFLRWKSFRFSVPGGMGAVYKARQKGLDRLVALKILPEEFGHDVKVRFAIHSRSTNSCQAQSSQHCLGPRVWKRRRPLLLPDGVR